MLKSQHVLHSLFTLTLIVLFTSCGMSEKERLELEKKQIAEFAKYHEEESDPVFAQYADSLDFYFTSLETDLIKQYKKNHETLQTEQDFYYFYRNASTLKGALSKRMKNHAREFRKNGIQTLHTIEWFKTLAQGLDVAIVHNGLTYEVFFDYKDLHEHAFKTNGKADDEFVLLLEKCYVDHSYFPKWVMQMKGYKGCSKLGSGMHLEIFEQMDEALSHNDLFKTEIDRVKRDVMNDILYRHHYCYNQEKVSEEISTIISDVLIVSDHEKELLQKRLNGLKNGTAKDVQFGCLEGDCTFE